MGNSCGCLHETKSMCASDIELPTLDFPMLDKPMLEKPTLENPTQLNKDI